MALSASRTFTRVERWFFDPVPIDAMVIARVLLGASLFFSYAMRIDEVQTLWGPQGLAGPTWLNEFYPQRPEVRAVFNGLQAVLAPSEALVWLLYAAVLVGSLGFALGFRTRAMGLLALLVHAYLVRWRLPLAYWGWSVQIQPLIVYVICSRAGSFASIDAWLARRRAAAPAASGAEWVGSAWPMRLLMIHTCTMYLTSGGERLDDAGWIHGQGVWIALSNSLYSKVGFDFTPLKPLLSVATWGTWVLEATTPVLLWVPRARLVVAYLSIAMHVGLEILTLVGYWNFCMVAGLVCFLPLSHLRVVTRRLPGGPAS